MNLSPPPPPLVQQDFELDTKEKWVKAGRRKTEGWARKVFRILLCQQENRPTRKPGRKKLNTAMAAATARPWLYGWEPSTALASATPLLISVRPQAKKTRTNRGERSPPRQFPSSGTIRQGPTFRFLARPRDDVMMMRSLQGRAQNQSFPCYPN